MENTVWIDNFPEGDADSLQPAIKQKFPKPLHPFAKCENY